ncbi:MAG: hypothetical protein UU36_C0002G0001, partial [Candidatus Uhrbacteria bacterium GW2011_GWE2_41_1153]
PSSSSQGDQKSMAVMATTKMIMNFFIEKLLYESYIGRQNFA